ncbi:MAG: leucyl/phenylalanyl-tRNA--protein transferase, partial [Pyrinomonadaceae bacterium]|nr:leucyl/phenylalanyl-tRNA--protein transferase [Pyrinomonadaceae bacterium]
MVFPNPRQHDFAEWALINDYYYDARDIVSFGDELTVENLQDAYRKGIFPWHHDGLPLPWFCPTQRAILEFSDLHIPKSLQKDLRKSHYTFTIDADFPAIIKNCARIKRSGQNGTWITRNFIKVYTELHERGEAHSVEVWEDNELVGGLYGVDNGTFGGESMFHLRPSVSKFAVLHLIEHLKTRGATWIDIQTLTPHFKMLGAKEIPRAEFLTKLAETQARN